MVVNEMINTVAHRKCTPTKSKAHKQYLHVCTGSTTALQLVLFEIAHLVAKFKWSNFRKISFNLRNLLHSGAFIKG